MNFLPLPTTPHPHDTAELNYRRAVLDCALAVQAHIERAIIAGTASHAMIDKALRDKHLSRVLAGPVAAYGRKSGLIECAKLLTPEDLEDL